MIHKEAEFSQTHTHSTLHSSC